MSLISIHDVVKTYNHTAVPVHALNGVTLTVEQREFTAIVGPSGSGKTTLLNIVGGLDQPTSGTVIIDDVDISSMKKDQLIDFRLWHIGFVFQAYNLIPVLTAQENVEFIMLLQGVAKKERDERTKDLLEAVGLADRAHNRPAELSGGQQQRVAIARSLVNDPQLILADEPTGNLDTASGASIMQLLSELHKGGRSVLVVTHDPRMRKFATQVVFLIDGHLVEEEEYNEAVTMAMKEPSAA